MYTEFLSKLPDTAASKDTFRKNGIKAIPTLAGMMHIKPRKSSISDIGHLRSLH